MIKTEDCQKFIIYVMQRIQGVKLLQDTPEKSITVSFLRKMLASSQSVLNLGMNGYDACIIACHMVEGIMQLNWLLDNPKRIKDYEDYNIIEMLALLKVDNTHKEFLLSEVKNRNIQRHLKKDIIKRGKITDAILLNQKNYNPNWYNSQIEQLSEIKQKVRFEGTKKAMKDLYGMYRTLCAYKHYAPYVMPSPYNLSEEWAIKPLNTAVVATLHCLYLTVIYTSQIQNNALDVDDIMKHYNQVLAQ